MSTNRPISGVERHRFPAKKRVAALSISTRSPSTASRHSRGAHRPDAPVRPAKVTVAHSTNCTFQSDARTIISHQRGHRGLQPPRQTGQTCRLRLAAQYRKLGPPDTIPLHPQTAGRNADFVLIARTKSRSRRWLWLTTGPSLIRVFCELAGNAAGGGGGIGNGVNRPALRL